MSEKIDPYVGPRPFEQNDRRIFFGRNFEANELVSLIIAHPVVLLYAQSGAGKTSLVRAGVIPLLVEEEKFDVLPPARVREQGLICAGTEDVPNIYIFNALVSMSQEKDDGDIGQLRANQARMTLAEFLKKRKSFPDQAESQIPSTIFFDQFEEFFTLYPERWEERALFFKQIHDALAENPLLRVVFSMREDFIAELDPYANILPEKLRTRFRMGRLRRKTAFWAVTKPLEAEGVENRGRRFAPGVAEELVANLLKIRIKTQDGIKEAMGEFVEPLQLQIVCQTLWRSLLPGDKIITKDHLKAYGDVDQALTTFYEDAIQKTVEKTGVKGGLLRRWFEHTLITPAGTRGIVFRGDRDTGGVPNQVVDELENQRLVRVELRGGVPWYELTHDRLIETVKSSNHNWLLERSGADQTRQRLEEKAKNWALLGCGDQGLLDEVELLEAERWLASDEASELGYTETLRELTKASRSAIQERRRQAAAEHRQIRERARSAKRLQWLAITLAAVTLIAIVIASYAYRMKKIAEEQRKEAILSEQKVMTAQKEKADAEREKEEQRKKAQLEGKRATEYEEKNKLKQMEDEAQASLSRGDYNVAKSQYEKLVDIYIEKDDQIALANVWLKLGETFHKSKDYDSACKAYFNAMDIKKIKSIGVEVGVIYIHLAEVYYDWGNNSEAQKSINYALQIFRKLRLNDDQPQMREAFEMQKQINDRKTSLSSLGN
jgi:tetratricopeptide (TPR) repeat protein